MLKCSVANISGKRSGYVYQVTKNAYKRYQYQQQRIQVYPVFTVAWVFAGLFISRVWESTLWYNMTLIFAIYILYRMPIEQAIKKRKAYRIHGLADPLLDPSLALPVAY